MCNGRAMRSNSDLIGSAEACRVLNVHPSTLTRWVAEGVIPAAHQLPGKNGARLFDRKVIERFDRDRRVDGVGAA